MLPSGLLKALSLLALWRCVPAVMGGSLVHRQVRTTPLLAVFPGQAALPTTADIEAANATTGTALPINNIQGDVLVGMKKQKETFYFFHINNAASFKSTLKSYLSNITSTSVILSPPSSQPVAFVNIAFSQTGLQALGVNDNLGDSQFSSGQYSDATNLGDDITQWESPFEGTNIHGVFLIGSDQTTYTAQYASDITTIFGSSITQVYELDAAARPGDQAGHEHFGFLDGISNPGVQGFTTSPLPGQAVIPPGVILISRLGDPVLFRPPWAQDGTFMAFRKLQQKVPEFNQWALTNALQNSAGTLTQQQGADLLTARMMGRWKSGAPVDLTPQADDPTLGADPTRNNNFDYTHLGSILASDQSYCPFSAHVRKTNPRADLPGNTANHAIRASTPYGPEVTDEESAAGTTSQDRGLAFVSYQSDIGNGFRFQQISWANTANFPPFKTVTPGIEPISGQGGGRVADGLNPANPGETYAVPLFVVPKGGEYFFMPSISALSGTIAS